MGKLTMKENKPDAKSIMNDINAGRLKNIGKLDGLKKDGWVNLYTGIGTSRDKSSYTSFSGYEYLSDTLLTNLWVADGFASKISKAPADDMTREWITVEGDEENKMEDKLITLNAQKRFNSALRWMRHYGGALVVMGVNDGRGITEPVDINNIKSIDYLRTYDRSTVTLTEIHFDVDPNDTHYGEPEFYTVTPKYTAPFNVHWTRCLVFKGIEVPTRADGGQFWYWGMSAIQQIWDQVKDLGAGERNTSKLLYEFIVGKYKIRGLAKMMAEDNWDKVKKIMDIVELGKSTIQAILLDAEGDDYTRDSASVAGLPDILDRLMQFLAGVSDIPVTRLFGRSAAGMNATGEGDLKNYYDFIRSAQVVDMIPQAQILVQYINISKEFSSFKIDNPRVNPKPLFQETQEQIMANRKIQAEIDEKYINLGVYDADTVRESRFENGYSFDTNVEDFDGEDEEEFEVDLGSEEQKDSGKEQKDSIYNKIRKFFK